MTAASEHYLHLDLAQRVQPVCDALREFVVGDAATWRTVVLVHERDATCCLFETVEITMHHLLADQPRTVPFALRESTSPCRLHTCGTEDDAHAVAERHARQRDRSTYLWFCGACGHHHAGVAVPSTADRDAITIVHASGFSDRHRPRHPRRGDGALFPLHESYIDSLALRLRLASALLERDATAARAIGDLVATALAQLACDPTVTRGAALQALREQLTELRQRIAASHK